MRYLLMASVLLAAAPAFATQPQAPSSVAVAGAEQGQFQGQAQGQSLSTRQLNELSLRNANSANAGALSSSNGTGVGFGGTGGSASAINLPNATNAPVTEVSTNSRSKSEFLSLAPAALTAGVNPCAVSVSAAGGAGVIGGALGVSWSDTDCNRRANAATLVGLGLTRSAQSLMCLDKDVKAAMVAAGEGCGE